MNTHFNFVSWSVMFFFVTSFGGMQAVEGAWITFKQTQYYLPTAGLFVTSFNASRDFCADYNAELPDISSKETQQFITAILTFNITEEEGRREYYYVGCKQNETERESCFQSANTLFQICVGCETKSNSVGVICRKDLQKWRLDLFSALIGGAGPLFILLLLLVICPFKVYKLNSENKKLKLQNKQHGQDRPGGNPGPLYDLPPDGYAPVLTTNQINNFDYEEPNVRDSRDVVSPAYEDVRM